MQCVVYIMIIIRHNVLNAHEARLKQKCLIHLLWCEGSVKVQITYKRGFEMKM